MEPASNRTRKRLLEEGARSYLKAATALVAYQREVQKSCRKVMTKHISEYGSALKVRLEENEVEDMAWPEFDVWEGDWASVGVRVVRQDIRGIRWWEAYCSLEWQSPEEPPLCCWIGEWFPTAKMAKDLFQRFKRLSPDVTIVDNSIGVYRTVRAGKAADFEEHLGELFQKWIRLWKKTGGIKTLVKAQ
jgi:hypothetical protein